jgi:COMPASS component SPP1
VCGYPLPNPKNILVDSENEICLAAKRSCSLHFKWEKLRRAQIDLEKLRTLLKLEELYEQKRANETALNQRKGLLSILLHQTTSESTTTVPATLTTTQITA